MIKKSPYLIIVLSFLTVIIVASLLLLLPFSVQKGQHLNWYDSLFISTSALCVTGLSPIGDIGNTLSVFGKVILTLIIQIGGLGFVTSVAYIMMIIGVKVGIEERQIVKEALNQSSIRGLMKFVKKVILITLIAEGVGVILYSFVFMPEYGFWTGLGYSIFHSVSAFNNCGFDLLGDNSFINYSNNILLNLNVMYLIIVGGIGFIVINDLIEKKFNLKKASINTKIVLSTSIVLWVSCALLLKLTGGKDITWLQAIFQSVSARTAGFATVDFSKLNDSSVMVFLLFMLIGAAPCSTGGGIKVTAAFAIMKSIIGHAFNRRPMAFKREISPKSIYKAYILLTMAIMAITLSTFLLTLIEKDIPFIKLLFESVSAFGTVGFSMGVTSILKPISKILLVPLMIMGRLGPLTLMALLYKRSLVETKVKYLEERLIIG